jgi:hypothetical protein
MMMDQGYILKLTQQLRDKIDDRANAAMRVREAEIEHEKVAQDISELMVKIESEIRNA